MTRLWVRLNMRTNNETPRNQCNSEKKKVTPEKKERKETLVKKMVFEK